MKLSFRHISELISKNRLLNITIPISGKCNFDCDFCAYKSIYDEPPIKMENYLKVLASIEKILLEKPNLTIVIDFTGGEPTYEPELLKKLIDILEPLKSKWNGRLLSALTTNGSWGETEEKIKFVDSLDISLIGISISKEHAKYNVSSIANILDKSKYVNRLYFLRIATTEDDINEVNELYSEVIPRMRSSRIIYNPIRYIENNQEYFLKSFVPVKSKEMITLTHEMLSGFVVLGDRIKSCCVGGGSEFWCDWGSIESINSSLVDRILKASFVCKSIGCKTDFRPLCLIIKSFGVECDCLDNPEFTFILKENKELELISA